MIPKLLDKDSHNEIASLVKSVFTSAEGEKEGNLVGNLAYELALHIDDKDIICFGAYENNLLIGVIFFSRLSFSKPIKAFLLAPVAISTKHQGKGVGQLLIKHGLKELNNRSISFVITYGDPNFYSKIGFQPLSESVVQAPLKLTMPEGWQGQSLNSEPIPSIKERPKCVGPFNDPVYW